MAPHISLLLLASSGIAAMPCKQSSLLWGYTHDKVLAQIVFSIFITSSKASNISILGWWMVHTTVLPVSTVFLTVLITIAAALASNPEVGSSMNMIEGFATSSTAMVSRLRCSVDKPFTPGNPTNALRNESNSTSSMTSSMNI